MKLLTYKIIGFFKGYSVVVEKGGELRIGRKCHIGKGSKIIVRNGGSISISDGCVFQEDSYIIVGGTMQVGTNCNFSHNLNLHVPKNGMVNIGNNVLVSYNVTIRTTDGHCIYDLETGNVISHNVCTSIVIEDHVWIGTGCIILYGAHIGTNSIVGAASLIKRRVEANCLVAGNPLRVLRSNVNWEISNTSSNRRNKKTI